MGLGGFFASTVSFEPQEAPPDSSQKPVGTKLRSRTTTRVVVKIRVPFRVLLIIRHLLLGYPKRDPNFDNYPHTHLKPAKRSGWVGQPH